MVIAMLVNCKKIFETLRMFEAKSNPDFLLFVVKWFSVDENNWHDEWEYIGSYASPAQCICGKEDLATVFIIENKVNKTVLSPIGSVCIRKFQKSIKIPEILDNLKKGLVDYLSRSTVFFKRNIAVTSDFFTKENIKTFLEFGLITEEELDVCIRALDKRNATLDTFQKGVSIIINKVIDPLRKSLHKEIEESTAPANSIYFTETQREVMQFMYENYYVKKKFTTKDIQSSTEKLYRSI